MREDSRLKIDKLGDWRRTHYSMEVTPDLDGKEIMIFGWVLDIRDLGAIRFIILQDREGDVQITILRKKAKAEIVKKADALQRQYSIAAQGTVQTTKQN